MLTTTAAREPLEHELLSATAKRITLVVVLPLIRVGIITAIEARPQLGVAKDLICFVDASHLLLGLLLGDALLDGLVGVELLRGLAVGGLDLALVGVVGYGEDLVVVLALAALQGDLGLV